MVVKSHHRLWQSVQAEDLVDYLKLLGWKSVTPADKRWLVFHGGRDIKGNSLEVVLPKDIKAYDYSLYLENTVKLLSDLYEDDCEAIVKKIRFHDTDLLTIRDLAAEEGDSITLELAAKQMRQLKRLVTYSASSENDPRPHFEEPPDVAKLMTDHYRFGHTFPGSFSFVVESQLVHKPKTLLRNGVEKVILLPIERRVMERIIRGLQTVQQATAAQDLSSLVEGYTVGFNAEMCKAVAKMSGDSRIPIEFNVLWSLKVAPSPEISETGPILLEETSYEYLEEASRALRGYEPEITTVRGYVVSVGSKDNMLESGDTAGSVVIEWMDSPDDEPIHLVVFLDRKDYATACKASESSTVTEVKGSIHKVGDLWRLSAAHDFRIVD
ncbi:MAG: hypothetical protein HC875_26775 [Anaerolineales bacterium]|nr:hypothetical protein [Anaerolineales bacterium]